MYEGLWYNGQQHGEALFTNSKGKNRKGRWENGKRVEWIGKVNDVTT